MMDKKTDNFKINISHNIDEKEWNNLLLNSPDATVFHTCEWIETLTKTYPNYEPIYITVRSENGKLIGSMPAIKSKNRFGFYSLSAMPFCTYGGPVMLSDCDEHEYVRDRILERFYKLSKNWMCTSSQVADFSGKCEYLNSLGFKKEEVFTYVVDLDSNIESIWTRKINKKVRNEVRQAIKKGVKIEEMLDNVQINEVYKMVDETDKKHKRTSYPPDLYRNIFNFMIKDQLIKWFIAKENDVYIANSLYFTYNDSIMHWMNASYKKYLNLRPNNLLQWKMIEWGVENGYKHLNLGGLPTTEATGLIKFKESWGAEKKEYYFYGMRNSNIIFKTFSKIIKLLKLFKR